MTNEKKAMNRFLKKILKPLYPVVGAGYGKCQCCGVPWNLVGGHDIYVDNGRGCFAVCEDCWEDKSNYEIVVAHMKLYDEWERGDKYNKPHTVDEIGYSRETLREAVMNALRERK